MEFLVDAKRVDISAFVIMPNHIHLIWTLLLGHKREDVQRDFLKFTAQQMKSFLRKNHPHELEAYCINAKDRKYQFWERNARATDLWSEYIFMQKLNYIHANPLQQKWQLCEKPEDYPWSSASFYAGESQKFPFLKSYLF